MEVVKWEGKENKKSEGMRKLEREKRKKENEG